MTGTASVELPDTLELVSNETRLRIIYALIDYRRENPRDPCLSFTALRKRAGLDESGNFNYHLNQLRGRYVEQVDGGYQLTHAGKIVCRAILSGQYDGGVRRESLDTGSSCPGCDGQVIGTYEDGFLEFECENQHELSKLSLPPGVVDGRSMDELLTAGALIGQHMVELSKAEICPLCYGRMTTSLVQIEYEGDTSPRFEALCGRCGMFYRSSVGVSLVRHPAVVAFYHDHGLDIRRRAPWELDFCMADEPVTLTATDPLEVRVDVHLDGDELRLVVNGDGSVVETNYQ